MDHQQRVAPRFRPKGYPKRNMSGALENVIEIIIVLIVVYYIATYLINAFSVPAISSDTTFTLSNQTTLFSIDGNQYSATLLTEKPGSSTAQIAITRQPTFLNPTLFVMLYLDNWTKVNAGTQYSNMQIKLNSINSTHIGVTITPLPTSLNILPDSSRITVEETTLSPFGVQSNGYTPITTASSTTTTTASTTTSTSTSTSSTTSTTTTISSSSNYNEAAALLHQDIYYGLMLNYTAMYSGESSCNPSLYNSTYYAKYGSSPSGFDTYQNVSGGGA